MYLKHRSGLVMYFMLASMASLLVACSSGSSSGDSGANISGSIVAGPVVGAQVSVTDTSGNVVVKAVTTGDDGRYSLNIPTGSLGQDLVITSSGGSFIDEATGNKGTADSLSVYMPASSISDGSSVSLTPGSTIIAALVMQHNKTMAEAKAAFAAAFGYTPDAAIEPVDVTTAPADGVSDEAKLSGLRAAAFSQLNLDLGLLTNQQFEMFAALAKDLSDDVLDGVDASGVVSVGGTGVTLKADIQNRFAMAMQTFHGGAYDKTSLANDQIGQLPFAKIAMSNSYKIEYIPGQMKAMEGKTMFTLRISDDNGAVTGLSPGLMPMMHMGSGMTHSSPNTDCTEGVTAGEYDCTVYYLMASSMSNGMSMGYWELKVMPTMTESVIFYPQVMMVMGDTVLVKLKGQADVIKDMMSMDENRNYYIFKDSLTGAGPYTLTLYIAAKEDMMSFPSVIKNNTLKSGMGGTPLDISSIAVNVTVNSGSPLAAVDNADGTWSVELALNKGVANTVEVELLVNGETKTSDGTAGGSNATFTLTPGMM